MKIALDDIMRALRNAPEGLTTAEISKRINSQMPVASLSSKLSKLAQYGKIDRELKRGDGRWMPPRWYVWKAKPAPAFLRDPIDQRIQGGAYDA